MTVNNIVGGTVCAALRLLLKACRSCKTSGSERLQQLVAHRPPNRPLLTISNHRSVMDEPTLWSAVLPLKLCYTSRLMRWTIGAQELMFTTPFTRWFFGKPGKVLPIVRGAGLHQYGIVKAEHKLWANEWVHIFPEGRVNQGPTLLPFKWGVGRLTVTSPRTPWVLPVYISGFEDMLPEGQPYIPKPWKADIRVHVGHALQLDTLVERLRMQGASEPEMYIEITRVLREEMVRLEEAIKAGKEAPLPPPLYALPPADQFY